MSDAIRTPPAEARPGHRLTRRRLGRVGLAALAGWAGTPLAGCGTVARPGPVAAPPDGATDPTRQPPPAPREWRAAWVATVANIDWPARPDEAPARQREQAVALLERASAIGLNALILQVRPAADAFYPSTLEPWSEYLVGVQGREPVPAWDPLQFWIDEAHRRGIELHAWFNPFRARHASARSPLAANHLARRQPALVRRHGAEHWMDPGEPEAAAHSLAVIRDVASRYDIDGVHLDDYFYPYPVRDVDGRPQPFGDAPSWRAYQRSGGRLSRDAWRRDNVDRFVEALYAQVHHVKPWLRVGLSPFGIGKPALRPPGIEGFSQYDELFADVERWCAEGWFDYLAPQLYWPIGRPAQAFEVLCDYWLAQNTRQRHVWPGLFSSRVGDGRAAWPVEEVLAQVAALRRRPGVGGHCHFSMKALVDDGTGLALRLQDEVYTAPALVPASAWLQAEPPALPVAVADGDGWRLAPAPAPATAAAAWRWAVWREHGARWQFTVQPGAQARLDPLGAAQCVVSLVDRVGLESTRLHCIPGQAPRPLPASAPRPTGSPPAAPVA